MLGNKSNNFKVEKKNIVEYTVEFELFDKNKEENNTNILKLNFQTEGNAGICQTQTQIQTTNTIFRPNAGVCQTQTNTQIQIQFSEGNAGVCLPRLCSCGSNPFPTKASYAMIHSQAIIVLLFQTIIISNFIIMF